MENCAPQRMEKVPRLDILYPVQTWKGGYREERWIESS